VSPGINELRLRLTRRRVLALGVGVGALTIAGSLGWLVSLPTPAPGRLALSAREDELLVRLAEVWFPPGNPLGVAAGDVDIGGDLDRLVVLFAPQEQRVLHALLRVVDQLPRATLRSTHTCGRLERMLPRSLRSASRSPWMGPPSGSRWRPSGAVR